ncbi:hypothetical protein N0V90_005569 [Kalmusia sp. IMI 367209]|nr:hypothetical protein N0V90_005569 [Kalmusia sp. IMI 367209]
MGKKKLNSEYNDFLDGEKLRDNAEVRTSLQGATSMNRGVSAPNMRDKGRGRKGKGGPKKPQLTHFLCLPLVNEKSRPQLDAVLENLKQELGDAGTVPLRAVRPVGTLHLTLGVMSLDDEHLEAAKRYLQDLDVQKILYYITAQATAERAAEEGTVSENLSAYAMPDTDTLSVKLKGLVPMQASHKTSILYAEPTDITQRLLPFSEKLKHHFTEEGFLVEDKRTLRLHATIINTIYAKSKGRHGKTRGGAAEVVNANGAAKFSNAVDGTDDHDDSASTAGSTQDGHEVTTAPPDPSTTETKSLPKLDGADGHGPNAKSWLRFDARDMIDRYKDIVWAEDVRIDRVQICKMGAKKILNDQGEVVAEEYEVVSEKVIGA